MKFSPRFLLCCLGLSAVSGQSIVDIATNDTELTTLATAVGNTDLVEPLATVELTVFAPTDEAFEAVDSALLEKLLTPEWNAHLEALLLHHVVADSVLSTNLTDGATVETLASANDPIGISPLTFSVSDAGVFISGDSFEGSQVIAADIIADNGVIHKVSQVLVPDNLVLTLWQRLSGTTEGYELIKTFLETTGLSSVLDGEEPVTVFVPPDSVIETLSEDVLASINATALLLNHVVFGVLPSSLATDGAQITTALGTIYTVTVSGTDIFIGDVPVQVPDVLGSNGIAHVIGGVLVPLEEGETVSPIAAPTVSFEPTAAPVVMESTPEPTTATAGGAMASLGMVFASMVFAAMAL